MTKLTAAQESALRALKAEFGNSNLFCKTFNPETGKNIPYPTMVALARAGYIKLAKSHINEYETRGRFGNGLYRKRREVIVYYRWA
jgi:hypothetical protein